VFKQQRLAQRRTDMIVVATWARIKAGTREQGLEHMQRFIAATCAEPGCVEFSMAFDVHDDDKLRVLEVYKDADALAAHRNSAHATAWRSAFGVNVVEVSFKEYEVIAGE
jgi:quinol monooxygenase YgiN